MRKMTKRFVSMMLAVAMVLSMSVGVFASVGDDGTTFCSVILKGTDGQGNAIDKEVQVNGLDKNANAATAIEKGIKEMGYTCVTGTTDDGDIYFSSIAGNAGTSQYYLVSEEVNDQGVTEYTYYWKGGYWSLYIDGQYADNYANYYKVANIKTAEFRFAESQTDPFTTTKKIEDALPAPAN